MKTTRFWLLCAVFTMGGLSVGAGPVARIGETDYGTLEEAVAAGGKIRLQADVTLDSLSVPSGAEVTLDLAGHSLTGTQQDQATIVVHGRLTVDDSVGGGRITHEGAVVIAKKMTSYASAIYNDGELSLLGGVICDCVSEDSTVWNAGMTVGLYYWIEECGEVGGEWRQIGCQMAAGNALTYYLFGSDGQSRYFRVGQSLSRR